MYCCWSVAVRKGLLWKGGVEMPFNWTEISGLWWTILPQLWIQLQIVYSRLKAQLQQILTLVHIFSSLSKLNSEQFEQLSVGMPCLHNQLHLQPKINLKIKLDTFDQWECKYCIYCVLIGRENLWLKVLIALLYKETGRNISNTLYKRVIFK